MPVTIRELLVRLGVRADVGTVQAFDAALDRAKGTASELVSGLKLVTGTVLATGAALAANSISVAAQAEATQLLADGLGVTADALQRYEYALGTAGARTEDVGVLLGKMSERANAVRNGNAAAAEGFRALGVSIDEVKRLSPGDLMLRLADGAQATKDPVQRMAALVGIVGDDAARRLAPGLMMGADSIRALGDEAARAGGILDEDGIQTALEYQAVWNRMVATLRGVRTQIGLAFLPAVREATEALTEFFGRRDVREGIGDYISTATSAVRTFVGVLRGADTVVTRYIGGWETVAWGLTAALGALGAWKIVGPLLTLSSILAGFLSAVGGVLGTGAVGTLAAIAAGIVGATMALWPFIAAGAALVLVLEDIYTWLTGGDSVLGRWLEAMPGLREAVDALWTAFVRGVEVMGTWAGLALEIVRLFASLAAQTVVGQALAEVFERMQRGARKLLDDLTGGAWSAADSTLMAIAAAADALVEALNRADGILIDFTDRLRRLREGGSVDLLGGVRGLLPSVGVDLGVSGARSAAQSALASGGRSVSNALNNANTYTFNGLMPEGIVDLIRRESDAQLVQAANVFRGGER